MKKGSPTAESLAVGVTDLASRNLRIMTMMKKSNALDTQVGGGHYKGFVIQPFEFSQKNRLPFGESSVIKYVCRHESKNGIEDLRKAKHFLELIALVTYGEEL